MRDSVPRDQRMLSHSIVFIIDLLQISPLILQYQDVLATYPFFNGLLILTLDSASWAFSLFPVFSFLVARLKDNHQVLRVVRGVVAMNSKRYLFSVRVVPVQAFHYFSVVSEVIHLVMQLVEVIFISFCEICISARSESQFMELNRLVAVPLLHDKLEASILRLVDVALRVSQSGYNSGDSKAAFLTKRILRVIVVVE